MASSTGRGAKSTTPPIGVGAYWVNLEVSTSGDDEPTDGRGGSGNSPATAIWDTLNLVAGTFEALIETITLNSATTLLRIDELHADGSRASFNVTPGSPVNLPMRDGFSYNTVGGGACITFRIQRFY